MTPRNDEHPDLAKLDIIAKARVKRDGQLPSVRKDSWQWAAWRKWYTERGIPTTWSDKQEPDKFLTVASETPPTDIDEAVDAAKSKGGGIKLRD